MGYRLIALDVDGTILTNERRLADRTRVAVARAGEAGAHVTLATGRMFPSAQRASLQLDIGTPIASSQGAYIADPVSGEVFHHLPLTEAMALKALPPVCASGMQVAAYDETGVYVDEMTPWAEAYAERTGTNVFAVGSLESVAARGLTRLVVVGDDREIELLEGTLIPELSPALYVTRSLPYYCEILHPDAGKDRALAWLCDHLGVRRDETLAFGNGYNDVRMLEWAGLGVAVADAVPEVLEVADRVAPGPRGGRRGADAGAASGPGPHRRLGDLRRPCNTILGGGRYPGVGMERHGLAGGPRLGDSANGERAHPSATLPAPGRGGTP